MEDEIRTAYLPRQAVQKPFLIRIVLATGLVSTEAGANYLLLGIAVLGFIATGILLSSSSGTSHGLTAQEIEKITQIQEQSGSYAQ